MELVNNSQECPTCKHHSEGEYCNACGEHLRPKRITLKYIFLQVSDVYLGVESGLLHTFIELVKNPGQLLRDYFRGKRQPYYKPMKYALLMGSLVILMTIVFKKVDEKAIMENKSLLQTFPGLAVIIKDNFSSFINMIFIIQFPLMALFTWLRHSKLEYTYGEHLYANAYFFGELLALQLILDTIMLMLRSFGSTINLESIYLYVTCIYLVYAYSSWIHGRIRFPKVLLSGLFIMTNYMVSFIVSVLLGMLFIYCYKIIFLP